LQRLPDTSADAEGKYRGASQESLRNRINLRQWSGNTEKEAFWRWSSWWPSLFFTIPYSSRSASSSRISTTYLANGSGYIFFLAIGKFCGPLFLGSLFDTVGRKAMIAGTFAISGFLLLLTAYLFAAGFLTPVTQTIAWFSIFFFASAAASSAYLTASEIFPLETRALAIACFYALGTAIGGSTSPLLFGWLIESGSAWRVSAGYALAAALLLIAAGTELVLGINAEGKSLESIADPLSS
jgi:MFS family permease